MKQVDRDKIYLSDEEASFLLKLLHGHDPYNISFRLVNLQKTLRDEVEKIKELAARARATGHYERNHHAEQVEKMTNAKVKRKTKPKARLLDTVKSLPPAEREAVIAALRSRFESSTD